MDKLFPQFGFDFALAAAVLGLFKFLNRSRRLNDYAADLLTKPGQRFHLQRQFLLIKQRLFGESFLSLRRLVILTSVYVLAFIWLFYLSSLDYQVPDGSLPSFWETYSSFYFLGWRLSPEFALKMLLGSFVLSLLSIEAGERVFRISPALSERVISRWLLMFAASAVVTCAFGALATMLVWSPQDPGTGCEISSSRQWLNYVWRLVLWNFSEKTYQSIVYNQSNPCLPDTSDGNLENIEFVVLSGTLGLSFSVMFLSPIVNFLYILGILVTRLHRFMLYKFGFDVDDVLDEPVDYIGWLTAGVILAAAIVMTLLFGNAGSMPPGSPG
jgi:hypothetical protein